MFRMWGKAFYENHMVSDFVAELPEEDTRTHKVFKALDMICHHMDTTRPIWFDKNINEFQKFSITRFEKDNFIEEVSFDYLEIRMIEED